MHSAEAGRHIRPQGWAALPQAFESMYTLYLMRLKILHDGESPQRREEPAFLGVHAHARTHAHAHARARALGNAPIDRGAYTKCGFAWVGARVRVRAHVHLYPSPSLPFPTCLLCVCVSVCVCECV